MWRRKEIHQKEEEEKQKWNEKNIYIRKEEKGNERRKKNGGKMQLFETGIKTRGRILLFLFF